MTKSSPATGLQNKHSNNTPRPRLYSYQTQLEHINENRKLLMLVEWQKMHGKITRAVPETSTAVV